MKILLLDNSHLPKVGGKEIVVHHLARQYNAQGHSASLAGPAGYRKFRQLDFGYPVRRTWSVPLLSQDTQWRLRLRYLLARSDFDVLHAHTTYPTAYHALRELQRTGRQAPLVVTPHGADIHKVPEIGFGKRLDPQLDQKIGWLVQHCDRTTAISASVRDSLIDAGAPAGRIVDIPNGVDVQRLSTPVAVDARAHLGLPATAPLFVSIGNYHPRKGHETLVAALAQCPPEAHLAIVGRQDPAFCAQVQREHGSRVIFTGTFDFQLPGATEPDVLAALLQQCTAYVSASMSEGTEGLSLALLEAMAARACVIATAVSGNRDVIENERNGLLVPPGDADALAAAMQRVCAGSVNPAELGDAAHASVADSSWQAIAARYLDLFESLLT